MPDSAPKWLRQSVAVVVAITTLSGTAIALDMRYAKAADVASDMRELRAGQLQTDLRIIDKERFDLQRQKRMRPLTDYEDERLSELIAERNRIEAEIRNLRGIRTPQNNDSGLLGRWVSPSHAREKEKEVPK